VAAAAATAEANWLPELLETVTWCQIALRSIWQRGQLQPATGWKPWAAAV
jgi:hypothetical protein